MNSDPEFSFLEGNPHLPPAVSLTETDAALLRERVRPWYTEKRYAHALGVEEEAARLGEILLPDRINALRAAALLHDITKKFDLEKQLKCCADFGIIITPPFSPEILHAVTAPMIAAEAFAPFTDREILSAIRWHTTGRWGMTVFEAIVFLADYIEPTRTHKACIAVRDGLYAGLASADCSAEREKAFRGAVLTVLDNTVTYLVEKGAVIDPHTVEARNYYLSKKEL